MLVMAAAFAVACLTTPLVVDPAAAQDVALPASASPWAAFWAALQAPLVVFATAVLTALGGIVSYYARRFLGERAALAVNESYRIAMEAAAGWLRGRLNGRTLDDRMLEEAIDYVTQSYPEVERTEPDRNVVGEDIMAAFGRLLAKA
jgi:hypothetical protein